MKNHQNPRLRQQPKTAKQNPAVKTEVTRRFQVKVRKALEIVIIVVSCGLILEFFIFLYYWIHLNITDSYLNAFFTVSQKLSVLISLSLYLTLLAILCGGISGLVGAAAKKPAAVFVSAVCYLEIFLGNATLRHLHLSNHSR